MSKVQEMSDNNRIEIKIVENEEERLKAYLVRAIVYMHEQRCPYQEEFDLNDHSATQIIGMSGLEPVLTARIRYFGGFAKLERLAIRIEWRNRGLGHSLIQFLMSFLANKGFGKLYLQAQTRLVRFYQGYGFCPVGLPFHFSNYSYVEMVANLPVASEEPVSSLIGKKPLVLDRPEQNPKILGPLERHWKVIS